MLKGVYKNDFLELEFEPLFLGAPKLTGKEVINKVFKMVGLSCCSSNPYVLQASLLRGLKANGESRDQL